VSMKGTVKEPMEEWSLSVSGTERASVGTVNGTVSAS
jgi:hypothetical protein